MGMIPVRDNRSMLERMQAGDLYQADDPEIAELATGAHERMAAYNASAPGDPDARRRCSRSCWARWGRRPRCGRPCTSTTAPTSSIGARTFANFGLVALDVAAIRIGDDVQIGPNVQLLTPTHPVEPTPRRDKWEAAKPITIGNNVWLGGGAIVLPGVTIGDNTVVGAGAVVTKDLPADVIAVGNPAKVIGTIGEGRA